MIKFFEISHDKDKDAYLMIPFDDNNKPVKINDVPLFCYFDPYNQAHKEDLWKNLEALKN